MWKFVVVSVEQLNGVQDLQEMVLVKKRLYGFRWQRQHATLTTLGLKNASPPVPEMTVTVTVLVPLTKVPAGTLHS